MLERRAVMPEVRARSFDARAATVLGLVAFGVRLGWGLAAGVTPGGVSFDDAAWYHRSAITLAHGGGYLSPFTGYPTAAWPPGYPLVLSLGYRVGGAVPATAVVMNAVFGALTCLVVWRLGARLAGPRAGVVAAALLTCFPSHVFFAALVLSETLFTCLVCSLLLAAVRLLQDDDARPVAWLVWGCAAGATALVRAESVALALVPALSLLLRGNGRTGRRVLAATLAGLVLALAPWTLRNFRVFGTVVPTSTGFGRTLWIGHNPLADGSMNETIQWAMHDAIVTARFTTADPSVELAVDRLLRGQALAFAASHPRRELTLVPLRIYQFFRGDHVWSSWYDAGAWPSAAARRVLAGVGNIYYAVVGMLACAGLVLRRTEPAAGWRLLDVLVVVWVAIFAAIYGDPRFHQLLIPFACILAAVTLERVAGGGEPDGLHATPGT